jgi:alpha-tubulin suppressor-like RCC1 family protein
MLGKKLLGIQKVAAGGGGAPGGGGSTTYNLFTWGINSSGQLGDGTTVAKSSPVQIGGKVWTKQVLQDSTNAALNSSNILFAWGAALIGDGSTTAKSSPVQIGSSSWTAITRGGQNGGGIRTDGALFIWGAGTNGQIGNSTTYNAELWSSGQMPGTTSWTALKSIGTSSFAIRSDGALFAWGVNSAGQLGLGDRTQRSSPVQVGTSSWTALAGNSRSNMMGAIRSDGALFAWGYNGQGGLGIGNTTNRSSPVQIGTSSWTSVGFSRFFGAAIRKDGALFTWGFGDVAYGGLGDGTTTARSSPVQVGSSSWTALSVGYKHRLLIRKDGALFAWGTNANGELGDGTTVAKSTPIQIGTASWVSVNAGTFSSSGLTDGTTVV